jgi:DNA-binding NarL/FixJ family response regulator
MPNNHLDINEKRLNVAITDDHHIVGRGLKDIFNKIPTIGHIYFAHDSVSLLKLMKQDKIDLVILDINLPGKDGLEIASVVKAKYKKTKVVMFSSYVTPEYVYKCYEQNVDGYINKTSNAEEIKEAIKNVIDGEQYFCSDVKNILLKRLIQKDHSQNQHKKDELSSREIEILQLICNKKNYKQIAELLYISENTVRKHRQNLMIKINCHSVTELYEYALKNKIISVPKN